MKSDTMERKNNEHLLKSIMDTMTDGLALNEMVFDNQGEMIDYKVLFVNDAFYRIADYSGRKVIGSMATELYGMSADFIRSFWKQHRTRDEAVITEMVSPISKRHFSISTSPFKDKLFLTVFRDITEIKQLENEIKDAEAAITSLLENSKACIWSVDRDYKLLFANSEFMNQIRSGLKRDIEKGETVLFSKLSAEEKNEWKGYYNRALSGESYVFERKRKYAEGKAWNQYHFGPIRGEMGAIIGAIVIAYDVSERYFSTEENSRLLERLNLATSSSELGIWDWDIVSDTLIWDDQMYKMYGVKREDFNGAYEAWLKGIHPDDREYSNKISVDAREKGLNEYFTEFRVLWPDGTVRYIEARGQIIRDDFGKPVRMIGVNIDRTESKMVEKELIERKEQLELANENFIGRELKLIELKKEVNELLRKNGLPEKYVIHTELG